ncbi:MAG: FMN-binding glutamate synthase family protein [Spirochaetales bacterium]|nr:FMN-binding glutamate synthase family protein [Spirochaetales bacterium]
MVQYPKINDALGTVNRGNPAESGLCTLCTASCEGRCETWLSSMLGRKMLYPRDYGITTSGASAMNHIGACYASVRIQGYNYGAMGLPGGVTNSADDCVFPNVSLETQFGNEITTKARVPLMTGALGSTFIAAKYWESFAIGAALVGIPIVIGENVVGIDRDAVISNGRIEKAPELDRRIETYLKYYDGYGAIIVQMNVEDTRNGVAEYVVEKYGDKVIIELKWGQGAKDIGGEIQVNDLDYAIFLRNRGYVVDPDPTLPEVQESFKHHGIKSFARHSRLGYTDLSSPEKVQADFMKAVEYLRGIGYKRITLKTGSYGMEALAMSIKYATDAKLDLLTVDGAGGGTGMSPWNMMETWGVPSIFLHAKTREYAEIIEKKSGGVVDLALAGGLAREDHMFKALALGSPYIRLICMGRALMIPGFLGSNIEGAMFPEKKGKLSGHWDKLPSAVTKVGTYPEEIFAGYYDVQHRVGEEEMKNIPYGALALWTLSDKLGAGLQQLMAGARKFSVSEITRDDLVAGNRETQEVTGLPYITEALDASAKKILQA